MEALAKISKSALIHNYAYFQQRQVGKTIIPVVKADAYGHGAIDVVKILIEKFNVKMVAVATLEEAEILGSIYTEIDILIFSKIFHSELNRIRPRFIITITSIEDLFMHHKSQNTGQVRCHLNFNTGMNRLGITLSEYLSVKDKVDKRMVIEGIYSHFATSDEEETSYYYLQQKRFRDIVRHFITNNFNGLIHLANSASGIKDNFDFANAMRLGISLYGYDLNIQNGLRKELKQVMTVEAPVVGIFSILKGESVSYGRKWFATEDTRIATIRIGYADGLSRALTSKAFVYFNNKLLKIIGTITMDHIMVEVQNTDIQIGDYVTILSDKHDEISTYMLAEKLNTIPYEITCAISRRVKRVVVE